MTAKKKITREVGVLDRASESDSAKESQEGRNRHRAGTIAALTDFLSRQRSPGQRRRITR